MHKDKNNVLLVSMPFAETSIPSIQLALLETYLKKESINIETINLYLKAAEFFGLKNYNFLINSPNDSYVAQMIFSKYVFPEYWEQKINDFKDFYNKNIADEECFSFEDYEKQTDEFYNWTIKNIKWDDFDIVGFTLNYGQILPSLAIAKEIKQEYPDKKIVFGGSSTVDQLGIRVLETFDWIDFIVSGEGENTLYKLAIESENYKSIPGLIHRNNDKVIFNPPSQNIDLNTLPFLTFNSYYRDLSNVSDDIQQYFHLYGRLPIEFSRGCWWNKCSFCNIQLYHKNYREKAVDRFVEELKFLSDSYKILNFQVIANTLPQKDYRLLCEEITKLEKNFSLCIEARSGKLKNDDYPLLKKAGFTTIQTGIETFSQNYIKKINKGVRVIDNVAALKFCKENGIKNCYNLISNYPNEEKIDYEQTIKNTSLFRQYLDTPQISNFVVGYGSPIFSNLDSYNIKKLDYKKTDKIMYPKDILEKNFCFFYNFKRLQEYGENDWKKFVEEWTYYKEKSEINSIKTKKLIDRLIFYFVDGGNFLKIYDKRSNENVMIYVLDELERKIFCSCLDVVSYQSLQDKFLDIPDYQLAAILHSFEKSGIVFKEDEWYLSLPLNYERVMGIDNESSSSLQTESNSGELLVQN